MQMAFPPVILAGLAENEDPATAREITLCAS
jgi:hypothetical protein